MQVRVLHSHWMYWIPILPLNETKNYVKWRGIAVPLPLERNWFLNLKLKEKTYRLATDKIFSTPTTNFKPVLNSFDKSITTGLASGRQGIKISLSGRLKGISKAKNMVITHGVIRPQSIDNKLDYYARPIYTKWGTIGLKVICS